MRHLRGLGHLGCERARTYHQSVGPASRRHETRSDFLDFPRGRARAREISRRLGEDTQQPALLFERTRAIRAQTSVQAMLLHQRQQALDVAVHMLCRVRARQNNNWNSKLDIPENLAAEVQEIGEVTDTTHDRRGTPNDHLACDLVQEQRIIEVALNEQGLCSLVNLRDPILLVEIESLVCNELCSKVTEKERLLDGTRCSTTVNDGNPESLRVRDDTIHYRRRRQNLAPVGIPKRIHRVDDSVATITYHLSRQERCHRKLVPCPGVELSNPLQNLRPQCITIDARGCFETVVVARRCEVIRHFQSTSVRALSKKT
mmetsp:Transcript_49817/g.132185  ORF Transcript_49817/g.132185 Transcript_49817/m.132185 type:complete len:316 (-) Transcript_49817:8-955(-)